MGIMANYLQRHRWTGLLVGVVIALTVGFALRLVMELTRPVFY
jgi:hypothetical protein